MCKVSPPLLSVHNESSQWATHNKLDMTPNVSRMMWFSISHWIFDSARCVLTTKPSCDEIAPLSLIPYPLSLIPYPLSLIPYPLDSTISSTTLVNLQFLRIIAPFASYNPNDMVWGSLPAPAKCWLRRVEITVDLTLCNSVRFFSIYTYP